jgi:hypothetical protein
VTPLIPPTSSTSRLKCCAAEMAAYKQTLDTVIDVAPERLDLVHGNPLNDLDEEVIALVNAASYAAFREGVRSVFTWAGGEATTPSEQLCPQCNGHGRRRGHPEGHAALRQNGTDPTCEMCGGTGTIPAEAG